MEQTPQQVPINTEKAAPQKKNSASKIAFAVLASLLLVSLLAYSVYTYSENNRLKQELTETREQLQSVSGDLSKLKEVQQTNKKDDNASRQLQKNQVTNTHDENFIALSPSSGFLSSQSSTSFEWAPHEQAQKYHLEIKMSGQGSYPDDIPADQIVTVNNPDNQPDRIKLQKSLPDGDYIWRVTAVRLVDGKEVELQSTSDQNYQVRT